MPCNESTDGDRDERTPLDFQQVVELGAVLPGVPHHHEGDDRLFEGALEPAEDRGGVPFANAEDRGDLGALQPLAQVQIEDGRLLRVEELGRVPDESCEVLSARRVLGVGEPRWVDCLEVGLCGVFF